MEKNEPQRYHAAVSERSKLITGVADCFEGLVFRVFDRQWNVGDIVRGAPWKDGNGARLTHSRIIERADPNQLRKVQSGLRKRARDAGKRMAELGRWKSGFWYRVIED